MYLDLFGGLLAVVVIVILENRTELILQFRNSEPVLVLLVVELLVVAAD